MAAWLPLAARRVSGDLIYRNWAELDGVEEQVEDGTIPLPCFGNATGIGLHLGFLALAMPSSGVFTRLTELFLVLVRFQGTCELGDIVSSPRCPCLRLLVIKHTWGMSRLTVHSESLLEMDIYGLNGLQQLNIDAPVLSELVLQNCFALNQPVANISAPQLISLVWWDAYDPTSVQLGNLEQLQLLCTNVIVVYGDHGDNEGNHKVLRFLQHIQAIHTLHIVLDYPQDMRNLQYLMEDITHLPPAIFLTMSMVNRGHTFGAASFHVLRLCTGIRRLSIILCTDTTCNLEAQSACPSGCICYQSTNWNIEELQLYCLQEVEIIDLKGLEHEVAFLKQLFNWAVRLEKLKIIFDYCVSKSKAREFCQRLSSISRPETVMEFCMYRNSDMVS